MMEACKEPLTYAETEALARMVISEAEDRYERQREERTGAPPAMLGIVF